MWISRLRVGRRAARASEGGVALADAREVVADQTEVASPGGRPSDPLGAGAQPEPVPPLRYGVVEEGSTRTVVVETLREGSADVPPPGVLAVRPRVAYVEAALGVALAAAAIGVFGWQIVVSLRDGEDVVEVLDYSVALVIAASIALPLSFVVVAYGWGKVLRADQEGIRAPCRIPWSQLDSIDIVASRNANGNAWLVMVTRRRHRRIHCDELRGFSETRLHQIAQRLLAMRDTYAAPPPAVYTPSSPLESSRAPAGNPGEEETPDLRTR